MDYLKPESYPLTSHDYVKFIYYVTKGYIENEKKQLDEAQKLMKFIGKICRGV
jgi:hypothetical protein